MADDTLSSDTDPVDPAVLKRHEQRRAYKARPEVKERERIGRQRHRLANIDEIRERERDEARRRRADPTINARTLEALRKRREDPEIRARIREQGRQYLERHKEERNSRRRAEYAANADKFREKYAKRDPVKRRANQKAYRERNAEKLAKYYAERQRRRLATNTIYKLRKILRDRHNAAIRGNCKVGSAIRDLGCSVSELKLYLESLFKPGMSWENYGYHGWHIDHKKPLAAFDLTDPSQAAEAFHYSNLQPLWAAENFAKSARVD